MSIFREHKTVADRSASDRRRHKQKIERAIKDGVHNIVADESIIGQDGKKKIKIPVRGIKQFRFVYGDNSNNQRVGSAPGKNIKRGQKIGKKQDGKKPGNEAGNQAGEEFYEVEITLEELASYLFDDLELPDLEKKQMQKIMSEKFKRHGYRNKGIRPRLDKKETVKKKLKRKNIAKANGSYDLENDEFPFHDSDLRYRHIKNSVKESSNAVLFFIMDVSGSMTQNKKYLARSFFFLLYHFIRYRYKNTELVFIAHDVSAVECDEEKFFQRGSGGGTIVSSALELCKDIMDKRYHPNNWNVYVFQCSDGDNWGSDMQKTSNLAVALKEKVQLFGYCEIEPGEERIKYLNDGDSALAQGYSRLVDSKFKMTYVHEPTDIWPAFKQFFGGSLNV